MGRRAMRRRQRREGRIHPHMLHTREEWARLCGRDVDPFGPIIDAVHRAWEDACLKRMAEVEDDAWQWGEADDFLDTADDPVDEEPTVYTVDVTDGDIRIVTTDPDVASKIKGIYRWHGFDIYYPVYERRHA